jgi:hypothetical protein
MHRDIIEGDRNIAYFLCNSKPIKKEENGPCVGLVLKEHGAPMCDFGNY